MSDAATLAVLKDVFTIAALALALGLAVYAILRVQRGIGWNGEGNVLSRPYNAIDAVIAVALMTFFGWVSMQGTPEPPTLEQLNSNAYAWGLFLNASFFIFIGILLLIYMGVYRGMNPAEMFGLRQMTVAMAFGQACLWLLGSAIVLSTVVYLVYQLLFGGEFLNENAQEVVETFKKTSNPLLKILLGIAAVMIAPLTEELIFRGFLYGVVKRFTERWFAAIFTALIFAAVHQHIGSMFPLFLLGIAFAVAYEVTGCLWVCIFMHALFNGFNVLMLSLQ